MTELGPLRNEQSIGNQGEFGQGIKAEIANQACTIKTQPKLIKKSREYNSRGFALAFYNIDNNKKGLYYRYMDGVWRDRTHKPHPGE